MEEAKKNLSRRNLIKAAALIPFGAVRGTLANTAVTVGVIGSGGRGSRDAELLLKHTDARLVALCDVFDDRIDRAKKAIPIENPKVYRNYRDLLASDVDAVIIATPVYPHPEHFEDAVKAGKHIYIEKPAAVDVAGCKRVIRAAKSADRKLNISFGFQQRYGPGYRKAKQLIDSGGIGPIRMAHSHWIKGAVTGDEKPAPLPRNEEEKIRQWFFWRDTSGDVIVETYCHGIDVLNWFLGGHAGKAYGAGGRTIEKRGDIMDHCDLTFTYPNKVQAMLTGTQVAPQFYRSVNEQFFGATGVVETAREYWTHYRGRNDAVTEKEPRDITADAMEEFVRRIREGKPENTGVRSAESTLTAIMGRMAIDLAREVTWEEMLKSAG
ncbi:MAG: Gfo/Idh/MocA family oxidoreductase [Acidobacteria bacterium]|nr:Gfo/Idh/MocA family oxidoreductase [Acidobacteriota bacterium]